MTARRTFVKVVAVGLLSSLVAACAPKSGRSAAGYAPKPDSELFSEVAALPDVSATDLHFTSSFSTGTGYSGTVRVKPGADGEKVLDQVVAILWQGRPDVSYDLISIQASDNAFSPTDIGLRSKKDYVERYGPQPGTGRPPS